jgi:hypothetical protein
MTGLLHHTRRGRHRPQQVGGLSVGEELLYPAGDQLEQQPVDAANDLRPSSTELVTAINHQP